MAEGKTANKYGDAGEYGIEEVEGAHCADAYEIEESPFDTQVGERLMQALEYSICAMLLLWLVRHNPSSKCELNVALYAPEPTQDIHRENSNARSSGNTSESLFCAWFPVREPVPADHDRNQTCNLCNGAGEQTLDRVEASVER